MKSNLKKLRKEEGLSLQSLGDLVGAPRQRIHQLESDDANPTLKSAYSIAKVLNKTVEEIWPNTIETIEETMVIRRIR